MATNPLRNEQYEELFRHAISLRDQGDLKQAASILRDLNSEARRILFATGLVLGGILMDDELPRKALPILRDVAFIQPRHEMASIGFFLCLWKLGRQEEALDEARRFQTVASSASYVEILAELADRDAK